MKPIKYFLFTLFLSLVGIPKIATPEEFKFPDIFISDKEMYCLTESLYFEARNQVDGGVLAVAKVILNRRDSKRFPNSICGVINQQLKKGIWQFSYKGFGKPKKLIVNDKKSWRRMQKIARMSLLIHASGWNFLDNAQYYYNPKLANPSWSKSKKLKYVGTYGDHRFLTRVK